MEAVSIISFIHHLLSVLGFNPLNINETEVFFSIIAFIWLFIITIELRKKISKDKFETTVASIQKSIDSTIFLIKEHIDNKTDKMTNSLQATINSIDHRVDVIQTHIMRLKSDDIK